MDGEFLYHRDCVKCPSSDGLAIYRKEDDEGEEYEDGYCWACSTYIKPQEIDPNYEPKEQEDMTTDFTDLPIADLSHRGIRKEVTNFYGIRQSTNESTGEPEKYHIPGGRGWKTKRFDGDKSRITTTKGYTLVGSDRFPKEGRLLIITEGEEDMMAAYQMFKDRSKDARPFAVTSLPHGASQKGKVDKAVMDKMDYITSFDTVILCFDQDESGRATAQNLAATIYTECKVGLMNFSEKDANDMLRAGKQKEFLMAFKNASRYEPDEVINGADISLKELKTPAPMGLMLDFCPDLMDKMKGLRPGELTILLAPSGVGKSTVCREFDYGIINSGYAVGKMFFEEGYKKTAQGLIAIDNNVPLNRFRYNPDILSDAQVEKSKKKLLESGNSIYINHRGGMDDESLLKKIRYLVNVYGCKYLILDHISMVFSGRETRDERKEMDVLVTQLGKYAEEWNIHLFVVAHIKRAPKVIQEGREGRKWWAMELDMARGSAIFEQIAWNVIGLEPEKTETGERGFIRLKLLKNREHGFTGPADIVGMDPETGRMVDYKQLIETEAEQEEF